MANDLQDLLDTVLMPQALPVLRENAVMSSLVSTDLDGPAAERNETIRVALPQDLGAAQTFNPVSGSVSTDLTDEKVDVVLDQWKYKQFQMNDKEMRESLVSGILPSAAESAIKGIANDINTSLFNEYKNIYNVFEAAAVPGVKADITGVRKVLNQALCPMENRRLY